MRKTFMLAALAAAVAAVAVRVANASGSARGAVFTLTNSPSGNAVAVFTRGSDGSLTPTAA
jgi:hypothetical protein